MKFQTLDLEQQPPAALKDHFDIVIGTNCVHATTTTTASAGRLQQFLVENGFLVLSEIVQNVDWYDIVFGLLDGWWLARNRSSYPLRQVESLVNSFKDAGFKTVSYSQGSSPDSTALRLLVASKREVTLPPRTQHRKEHISSTLQGNGCAVETLVYKEVEGLEIPADIYLPKGSCSRPMPVGNVPI